MTAVSNLKKFLINREQDIATNFEDFGDLKEVFKFFIGREAKSS